MIISTNISILIYLLLAVGLVAGIVYGVWQWRRTSRLKRFIEVDEYRRGYLPEEQLPPVTILVYAHNDADYLAEFLPPLLEQDYPCYEVIVTDDSSLDNTKDVLGEMLTRYSNLRASFVPAGSRALSRKKLSIMLGVKAAKHDIIVTTTANCCVPGSDWLRHIARNFTPGTDVVLAYSRYDYARDRMRGRRHRVFDTVSTAVQYMGSAIEGKPYRGIGDNLAYRKQVFFSTNGFANTLELKWGEDDIYVSEIARADNTRVELAVESIVAACYYDIRRAHHVLKTRRNFTSRQVSTRAPFVVQGFMSALFWLATLCPVAAIALEWQNVVVIAAAVVQLLLVWTLAATAIRKQCALFQAPKLTFTAPWHALWRPLVNIMGYLRGLGSKKSQYTSIID